MIRKYLVASLLALASYITCACAESAKKVAGGSPPHIVVLGHTVAQQEVVGCPKRPTNVDALAKYLKQYDVSVEKGFLSTAYKYSPLKKFPDEDVERPTGVLLNTWATLELEDIVTTGFGHNGDREVNSIVWMRISNSDTCDFASFGDTGSSRAGSNSLATTRIGRAFLFHGRKDNAFQLVMSFAEDQGDSMGQNFFSLDVVGEKFPIVIGPGDGAVFQWNSSINGFNVCADRADDGGMLALKIYVRTDKAPKGSFLEKLCSSPQEQDRIKRFLRPQ